MIDKLTIFMEYINSKHYTGWPKKKDTETVFWDKFDKNEFHYIIFLMTLVSYYHMNLLNTHRYINSTLHGIFIELIPNRIFTVSVSFFWATLYL